MCFTFFIVVHAIGTSTSELTIITRKSFVLLLSVQEFIETEAWVLLAFSLYTLNYQILMNEDV